MWINESDLQLKIHDAEHLSDLQRRFLQEVEESGFKIYNDCVDMPDDMSDNKRIGRKHNKPFYQKGRW